MFETLFNQATSWLFGVGTNLFAALLILLIGLKLIKKIRKIFDRTMEKAGVETTLRKFLNAFVYAVMVGVLIFIVAGEIGIENVGHDDENLLLLMILLYQKNRGNVLL